MTQDIEFKWGDASLVVPLPDTWRILGELRPRSFPLPENVGEACAEALRNPIGAQRLSDKDLSEKKVVVVVDDHSRPTPVASFINAVLEDLASAGVGDKNIEILLANGVHRESSEEEVMLKIGEEAMSRCRWRCHSAYDIEQLVDLGATERGTPVVLNKLLTDADLIVCCGAVEPHVLVGFGGGLKMILPGCAGAETIGANHMQGVDPDHFDYVGFHPDDSPMRLDLEEAVMLLGKEFFVVNVAMNEQAKPTRFFCGDPIEAHREGVAFVKEMAEVEPPEVADVVLSNSYPMDSDLRQSAKCIGNTLYASKPGGVMMGCLRCVHGLGEIPIPRKTLPYPILRTLIRWRGKDKVLPLVMKAKKGEPVEEIFVAHFSLQMLRRNHIAVFSESLPDNIGKKLGSFRSFVDIEKMVAFAAGKAPRNATVWVFPLGGVTYARMKDLGK